MEQHEKMAWILQASLADTAAWRCAVSPSAVSPLLLSRAWELLHLTALSREIEQYMERTTHASALIAEGVLRIR